MGCTTVTSVPKAGGVSTMSFVQSRKRVMDALYHDLSTGICIGGVFFSAKPVTFQVRMTPKEVGVSGLRGKSTVQFGNLRPVSAGKFAGGYFVSDSGSGVNPTLIGAQFHLYVKSADSAKRVAEAVNALIDEAKNGTRAKLAATEFETFTLKAKEWRELAVKPPYPTEIERQRILAEHAAIEKKYDEALEHFEAGLRAAPLWPEGHFNAAMLCGELEAYSDAVEHLRRYLELMPDAADAPAVRVKLVVWSESAK